MCSKRALSKYCACSYFDESLNTKNVFPKSGSILDEINLF